MSGRGAGGSAPAWGAGGRRFDSARPERKEENMRFVITIAVVLIATSCGGPRIVSINVLGKIEPKDKRVTRLLPYVPVLMKLRVSSPRGEQIFSDTAETKPDETGKFRADFRAQVENKETRVSVEAESKRVILFSEKKIFFIENCEKVDREKTGYDYICLQEMAIVPKVSPAVSEYLDFRERRPTFEKMCSYLEEGWTIAAKIEEEGVRALIEEDLENIELEFFAEAEQKLANAEKLIKERKFDDAEKVLNLLGRLDCLEGFAEKIEECKAELKAGRLVEEAKKLYEMENYVGVLESLREAVKIKPDSFDAHLMLASTYKILRRYDDALENYNKAIEIRPRKHEIIKERAELYVELGKPEKALADYEKAIELDSKNPLYWGRSGEIKFELGRYADALKDFEMASKLEPANLIWVNRMGDALKKFGMIEEAIGKYSRAVRLNPDHPLAYRNLGDTYFKLGKYENAMVNYEKLIRKDERAERDPKVLFRLARSYEEIGKRMDARAYYEKTVQEDPKNAEAYFRLAKLYREQGFLKPALRAFKNAVLNAPDNIEYMLALARFYMDRGDSFNARRQLAKILKLNPEHKEAKILSFELKAKNVKGSFRRLKIYSRDIEELDLLFSDIPKETFDKVAQVVPISSEGFRGLALYQKLAVVILAVDKMVGSPAKRTKVVRLRIKEKFKELFPDMSSRLAAKLAWIRPSRVGIE